MNDKGFVACAGLIIVVVIILWGQELMHYLEESSSVQNSTAEPNVGMEKGSVDDDLKDYEAALLEAYFQRLNKSGFNVTTTRKPKHKIKQRRVRRSRVRNPHPGRIPHAAFEPHTKDEFLDDDDIDAPIKDFKREVEVANTTSTIQSSTKKTTESVILDVVNADELESRDLSTESPHRFKRQSSSAPNGTGGNGTGGMGGPGAPGGGGGGVDRELARFGCKPVPRPPPPPADGFVGAPPPPPQASPYRPCPFEFPSTEEPVPLIAYKGRLQFGQVCWPDTQVAAVQLMGTINYGPDSDDEALVDRGWKRKIEIIESNTCDQTKRLECFQMDTEVGTNHKCACMAALGRETLKRLEINGECFIPAGKGIHSDCFKNQKGFPLPTGDTTVWKEWNPVWLPCVENSKCVENAQWFGRRCACKKYYKTNDDGTCSDGVVISGMTQWVMWLVGVGVYLTLIGVQP